MFFKASIIVLVHSLLQRVLATFPICNAFDTRYGDDCRKSRSFTPPPDNPSQYFYGVCISSATPVLSTPPVPQKSIALREIRARSAAHRHRLAVFDSTTPVCPAMNARSPLIHCPLPDPTVTLHLELYASTAAAQPSRQDRSTYLRTMQSLPKEDPDAPGLSGKQADSLAKKRARDRRAQQNQRDKRNEQVRSLQEQLTRMESRMLHLSRECELLRQENQQLLERQGSVSALAATGSTTPAASPSEAGTTPGSDSDDGNGTVGKHMEFWLQQAPTSWTVNLQSPNPGISPWSNTPAHSASDVVVTESFKNWLRRPDLVHASPEYPQPLELLYGSKTNFLADTINHSLRSWPCRDPERLASGWLMYHLIKWMLQPIPENYGRLQEFQLPVPEQLEHSHPYFIDFVHWPKLRANIIRNMTTESPQDILGLFLCCTKLRWPWGQNFLEPELDGTMKMRKDFIDTMTSLDGWALTDDFFLRFPGLGEGVDMDRIRYHIC